MVKGAEHEQHLAEHGCPPMTTKKYVNWSSSDIPSQAARRIIITGANSGIGWEATLALARAGAEVVLDARTTRSGGREEQLNEC
jgi:hypothetical protein